MIVRPLLINVHQRLNREIKGEIVLTGISPDKSTPIIRRRVEHTILLPKQFLGY